MPANTVDLTPYEVIEEKVGEMGKMWKRRISEDTLEIKKMHMYHFQVQGQLHVTKLICLFTIRTPKGLREENIYLEMTKFCRKMRRKARKVLFVMSVTRNNNLLKAKCADRM